MNKATAKKMIKALTSNLNVDEYLQLQDEIYMNLCENAIEENGEPLTQREQEKLMEEAHKQVIIKIRKMHKQVI